MHIMTSFALHDNLICKIYILSCILQQRNYESAGLSDLPKVTWLHAVARGAAMASQFSEWCPGGRFCWAHGGTGS